MPTILFEILAVLRAGPEEARALLDELQRLTDGAEAPSIPAFYRHLRRGIDEGWIAIDGLESPLEGPGRPRQRYALTRAGEAALRAHAKHLNRFTRLALEGRGEGGRR